MSSKRIKVLGIEFVLPRDADKTIDEIEKSYGDLDTAGTKTHWGLSKENCKIVYNRLQEGKTSTKPAKPKKIKIKD